MRGFESANLGGSYVGWRCITPVRGFESLGDLRGVPVRLGITPVRGFESRFHHYLSSEWECITPVRGFESFQLIDVPGIKPSITPSRGLNLA